jgi:hypothetical protein
MKRICRTWMLCMLSWACATAAPAPQEKAKASLSPIHYAARDGDLGKVTALLKDNPALVFTKDTDGFTPLHYAALNGEYAIAKLLLANKADSNAKDNHGDTPLHNAAALGHKDLVELLLANGADVNARNSHGDTPLESAAALGHKDVADLLRSRAARGGAELSVGKDEHPKELVGDWSESKPKVGTLFFRLKADGSSTVGDLRYPNVLRQDGSWHVEAGTLFYDMNGEHRSTLYKLENRVLSIRVDGAWWELKWSSVPKGYE